MFRFASEEEGRALLGERDDFVTRLGTFERAVRMGRNGTAGEDEFLAFVVGCVREWPAETATHVGKAAEGAARRLARFEGFLPPQIHLVHTTGQEEAGSGYTRGAAIVLPPSLVQHPSNRLERFLVQKCFHLLNRCNPALQDRLCALLDFHPCGELPLPESIERWRITNPDAPSNGHAIRLQAKNRLLHLLPVLHWAQPRFLTGPYKEHVRMSLLEVQEGDDGWEVAAGSLFAQKELLEKHFERLGMTFGQPEEMLATIFAQLALNEENPHHSFAREMERVLA